jgi:hypothetical protein
MILMGWKKPLNYSLLLGFRGFFSFNGLLVRRGIWLPRRGFLYGNAWFETAAFFHF